MGFKGAIEANRQVSIELALIEGKGRTLRYSGDIFGQIGTSLQGLMKNLFARPARVIGGFLFGNSTGETFDKRIMEELNGLKTFVRKEEEKWHGNKLEQTSKWEDNTANITSPKAKNSTSLGDAILSSTISKIQQAEMSAKGQRELTSGHLQNALAEWGRANFERSYRESVMDPEAGERRMHAMAAASSAYIDPPRTR